MSEPAQPPGIGPGRRLAHGAARLGIMVPGGPCAIRSGDRGRGKAPRAWYAAQAQHMSAQLRLRRRRPRPGGSPMVTAGGRVGAGGSGDPGSPTGEPCPPSVRLELAERYPDGGAAGSSATRSVAPAPGWPRRAILRAVKAPGGQGRSRSAATVPKRPLRATGELERPAPGCRRRSPGRGRGGPAPWRLRAALPRAGGRAAGGRALELAPWKGGATAPSPTAAR